MGKAEGIKLKTALLLGATVSRLPSAIFRLTLRLGRFASAWASLRRTGPRSGCTSHVFRLTSSVSRLPSYVSPT
jgi:hypothetical protein